MRGSLDARKGAVTSGAPREWDQATNQIRPQDSENSFSRQASCGDRLAPETGQPEPSDETRP